MSDIPGYRTSELRSFNHLSPATIACETAQASIRSGFEHVPFCFSAEPDGGVPPPSGVGGAPTCPL